MMNRKTMTGFSLMELLVVIVILGIITSIALPSYQESIAKARRSDAQGALYGLASAMERFFTENTTYCGSDDSGVTGTCVNGDSPGIFSAQVPVDGGNAYYDLTIATTTTTTYTINATRTGVMTGDKCGDFTLNSTNVQGITNQDAGVVRADCWR